MTILLGTLVILNGASVWTMLSYRRSATALALQDLQLQTAVHARSLEAVISSRRSDFVFLSQSSPLADAPLALAGQDPVIHRWNRLDIEESLLLFLVAHPEVERLVLRDAGNQPLVAGGYRDGAPVLLPPRDFMEPARSVPGRLVGSWKLRAWEGKSGSLEVVIVVARLLELAVPGLGPGFELIQTPPAADGESARNAAQWLATEPVRDESWPGSVRWELVCLENPSRLIESVAALAGLYRTTVLLNLLVMGLALILGAVGFQQMRRRMALETESRQQARLRELERQVLHNERLASLGLLAAGMAHEINNPLEGMSNYLSLLETDLLAQRTESSLELVQRIREGVDRAAGITRQALTFADPGAVSHAGLDMNRTLAETVSFVRTNPLFRNMAVSFQPAAAPLSISGNRVTLGQLFLNLLLNACQVQPEGGSIDVAAWQEGSAAVVEIADSGPGIPEESLPRLFEPFYSIRGSTGLGLSVCLGIVTQHAGRIQAANRANGAVFRVELPLLGNQEMLPESETRG